MLSAAMAASEHLRTRVAEMEQDTVLWQEGLEREASARRKCNKIIIDLIGDFSQYKEEIQDTLKALRKINI